MLRSCQFLDDVGEGGEQQAHGHAAEADGGANGVSAQVTITAETITKNGYTDEEVLGKVIEGIRFMSPSRMIKTKRRLGRKKDLEDVKLLRAYLRDRAAARKAARAKQADK